MNLPDLIALCLSLPDVEETTPFGPDVLVYKVHGKIWCRCRFVMVFDTLPR